MIKRRGTKQLVTCNKLGISAANLEADNLHVNEIVLQPEQFTNELIFDLNRYCSSRKWSRERCAKWIMILAPSSLIPQQIDDEKSYLLQVVETNGSIQRKRDALFHNKWYVET